MCRYFVKVYLASMSEIHSLTRQLIQEPTKKEERFCTKMGIEIIKGDIGGQLIRN